MRAGLGVVGIDRLNDPRPFLRPRTAAQTRIDRPGSRDGPGPTATGHAIVRIELPRR